ncbi:myb/sant-like dna-binding domain [Holotrichia oblita]|uniref:Myb/sant-like dna-binding domain n=1 Tax=Holotrichia oblita TaxID=644536 RepID=A0ACB9SM68_HOLOL|nr:myb/sant-like dna-binding domain [Holotrichia oblita]
MSRKSRMTKSQKEIIVNFLEHNDSMIKNIKHTPAELNVLNKKWEELVTLLNSTDGAKKTAKEWKEAINEFKTNVRRKARAITYDHQGAPDIPEAGIATAGPSSAPINVVVDAPLNVVVDAPLNVVADTTLEDYIIINQEPELQTMMSWEKEQERLQHLMDEPTDDEYAPDIEDDNDSFTEDNVETIEENIGSEQEFSDNELNEIAEVVIQDQRTHRQPIFEARDGTKWSKHIIKRDHVKTRSINIVTHFPGPKGEIRHARKCLDVWRYLFTDVMLENIQNRNSRSIMAGRRSSVQKDILFSILEKHQNNIIINKKIVSPSHTIWKYIVNNNDLIGKLTTKALYTAALRFFNKKCVQSEANSPLLEREQQLSSFTDSLSSNASADLKRTRYFKISLSRDEWLRHHPQEFFGDWATTIFSVTKVLCAWKYKEHNICKTSNRLKVVAKCIFCHAILSGICHYDDSDDFNGVIIDCQIKDLNLDVEHVKKRQLKGMTTQLHIMQFFPNAN